MNEQPELQELFNQFKYDIGEPIEVYEFNPKKLYSNFEDYQKDELTYVERNLNKLKAHSTGKNRNIYNEKLTLIDKWRSLLISPAFCTLISQVT